MITIMKEYQERKMKREITALIVASPGRIRDSLRALLKNVPRIETILLADDSPSALRMIAECHPALVLLDSKLVHHDIQEVLAQVRAESPQTRCIVLADNTHQQWLAKAANADSVLLAGFPAAMFLATVEGVLSRPGAQTEKDKQQLVEQSHPGQ
jgi:DNA-binding NarL/FixJ family response regulator